MTLVSVSVSGGLGGRSCEEVALRGWDSERRRVFGDLMERQNLGSVGRWEGGSLVEGVSLEWRWEDLGGVLMGVRWEEDEANAKAFLVVHSIICGSGRTGPGAFGTRLRRSPSVLTFRSLGRSVS